MMFGVENAQADQPLRNSIRLFLIEIKRKTEIWQSGEKITTRQF